MFVVIKKKTIVTAALILVAIALVATAVGMCVSSSERASGESGFVVVLDAGHGGADGGVRGAESGVYEREINLMIVREVEALLEKEGVTVVLTRENAEGLYDSAEEGFKKRDFAKRKAIIEKSGADLVVSVHCNKFPDRDRRGAQCFFEPTSSSSTALAEALQAELNALNEREISKTYSALQGDYFMLKCSELPSAIVECGFLSNIEDDRLLNSAAYRTEISSAIAGGIMSYLDGSLSSRP